MKTNFQDVQDFHNKFGIARRPTLGCLNDEAFAFRVKFLQEELQEFSENPTNIEEAADALIDLSYVTLGTIDMMGGFDPGARPASIPAVWPASLLGHLHPQQAHLLDHLISSFVLDHQMGRCVSAYRNLQFLQYTIVGTADLMGLPWQLLWDEVQRANMSKVRATSAEQSKRGSALDIIKPAGWMKPDHRSALGLV